MNLHTLARRRLALRLHYDEQAKCRDALAVLRGLEDLAAGRVVDFDELVPLTRSQHASITALSGETGGQFSFGRLAAELVTRGEFPPAPEAQDW